jgi:hypothetical protein
MHFQLVVVVRGPGQHWKGSVTRRGRELRLVPPKTFTFHILAERMTYACSILALTCWRMSFKKFRLMPVVADSVYRRQITPILKSDSALFLILLCGYGQSRAILAVGRGAGRSLNTKPEVDGTIDRHVGDDSEVGGIRRNVIPGSCCTGC